jgi:hypothetical protein
MHPVQCPAPATGAAVRARGTYCGGWRRHCACLDAKTRVLAVGALASTTCNNFIADLLFLSEVSHPLLVAGPPCVHPYLGKSALCQRQPPPGRGPGHPRLHIYMECTELLPMDGPWRAVSCGDWGLGRGGGGGWPSGPERGAMPDASGSGKWKV